MGERHCAHASRDSRGPRGCWRPSEGPCGGLLIRDQQVVVVHGNSCGHEALTVRGDTIQVTPGLLGNGTVAAKRDDEPVRALAPTSCLRAVWCWSVLELLLQVGVAKAVDRVLTGEARFKQRQVVGTKRVEAGRMAAPPVDDGPTVPVKDVDRARVVGGCGERLRIVLVGPTTDFEVAVRVHHSVSQRGKYSVPACVAEDPKLGGVYEGDLHEKHVGCLGSCDQVALHWVLDSPLLGAVPDEAGYLVRELEDELPAVGAKYAFGVEDGGSVREQAEKERFGSLTGGEGNIGGELCLVRETPAGSVATSPEHADVRVHLAGKAVERTRRTPGGQALLRSAVGDRTVGVRVAAEGDPVRGQGRGPGFSGVHRDRNLERQRRLNRGVVEAVLGVQEVQVVVQTVMPPAHHLEPHGLSVCEDIVANARLRRARHADRSGDVVVLVRDRLRQVLLGLAPRLAVGSGQILRQRIRLRRHRLRACVHLLGEPLSVGADVVEQHPLALKKRPHHALGGEAGQAALQDELVEPDSLAKRLILAHHLECGYGRGVLRNPGLGLPEVPCRAESVGTSGGSSPELPHPNLNRPARPARNLAFPPPRHEPRNLRPNPPTRGSAHVRYFDFGHRPR